MLLLLDSSGSLSDAEVRGGHFFGTRRYWGSQLTAIRYSTPPKHQEPAGQPGSSVCRFTENLQAYRPRNYVPKTIISRSHTASQPPSPVIAATSGCPTKNHD
jgi:hypothetical protein